MSHYYTTDESLENENIVINYCIRNTDIYIKSNSGIFSKNTIDFGTNLLINAMTDVTGTVLDLGCGYGIIGISICKLFNPKKVVFSDVNKRALDLTKENLVNNHIDENLTSVILSNGFDNIQDYFDTIITNPPIRIGKENIYRILDDAYNHLNPKGNLYLVIQKKHGAASYEKKINELFGNCELVSRKKQVFVYKGSKKD